MKNVIVKKNAAFVGGGVSTVCGLGAYYAETQLIDNIVKYDSFSGASIGAVVAVCLAAGKNPKEIEKFLEDNVEKFCLPIIGKKIIRTKTDDFLKRIIFSELPTECIVSVTKIGSKKPLLITRENSENLTAGEVAALSASLPGLFLPGYMHINGEAFFVLDGGMTANPPLALGHNTIYSFKRDTKPSKSVWAKRKARQEELADRVVRIPTTTKTRGKVLDVRLAFEEGIHIIMK